MTGFVITQLSLCDFRGFSGEKSWTLGQLTKITGHNYQGKSSIADAIAFALTGAPYFGGRDLDRPHRAFRGRRDHHAGTFRGTVRQ